MARADDMNHPQSGFAGQLPPAEAHVEEKR